MLPTLAVFAGATGLLLIIFLIFRELKTQLVSAPRNMLLVVALVSFVVAAFHIVAGLGGGEH